MIINHNLSIQTKLTPYPITHLKSLRNTQEKTSRVALKIFHTLYKVLTFPARFFGSKTWSIPGIICRLPFIIFKRIFYPPSKETLKEELFGKGYNFGFEKKLSKEEFKPYFPMICMIAFIHSTSECWISSIRYDLIAPIEFDIDLGTIEKKDSCFFDKATGLKIAIVEKGDNVMIGFGALNSSHSELPNDPQQNSQTYTSVLKSSIKNLIGVHPNLYHQANEFIHNILNSPRLKGKNIILTGQCVGGSLASYVALKQNLQAQCVNSLPLGVGLQNQIGRKKLNNGDKYVSHISIRGDWTTDWRALNGLDRIINAIGIRTIGNFGRRFIIPSAFKECQVKLGWYSNNSHTYAAKSAFAHLGFDPNSKIQDVGLLL